MNPLSEYVKRRDRWRAEADVLQGRFIWIGNARLLIAAIAAYVAWLGFWRHSIAGEWVLLPVVGFIALFVWHQRVIRQRTLARRAAQYFERGIDRIEDRWMGTGEWGDRFRNGEHVYADDLDVFGKGSLFQMVSTARTSAGETTLARWFLSPGTHGEVLPRQAAVEELSTRLDLREEIAVMGDDVRAEIDIDKLQSWGEAAPVAIPSWLRPFALVCSIAGAVSLACLVAGVFPIWPVAALLLCDLTLIFLLRRRVTHIIDAADSAARDLQIFALLLERLERESFETPLLWKLRGALNAGDRSASKQITRLIQWIDLLHAADSPVLRLLKPLLLWDEQTAMAIEAWRRKSGGLAGSWLTATAEFEALSSLASLAFERPHWRFPELAEERKAYFEAEQLRHPLLPAAKCVPNDIRLGGAQKLLIVSGSNMSGKSTLLRAIGLNTILAWAGAPVAAKECRLSALQTAASIRVVDSLQDGRSRFLAEISRIRQIVDFAQAEPPVLFLLDEVLSGTNSHDRRIGASAIVRGLVNAGAIGLITTHDLALAEIERDMESHAINVHFDDQITGGLVEFDYQLRPGVVTHSNALELMRSVGLRV